MVAPCRKTEGIIRSMDNANPTRKEGSRFIRVARGAYRNKTRRMKILRPDQIQYNDDSKTIGTTRHGRSTVSKQMLLIDVRITGRHGPSGDCGLPGSAGLGRVDRALSSLDSAPRNSQPSARRARTWMTAMSTYTAAPQERLLPEILSEFGRSGSPRCPRIVCCGNACPGFTPLS